MQNFILFAIPFFFLTMGIEYWVGRRKGLKLYSFEDTITNLNIGIGNQTINILAKVFILAVYAYVYNHWRIFTLPDNTWWIIIITYIIFDYIYYWAHRLGHEWNYMWGAHIVHHQSTEFNLSVALRQSWFHGSISFFMFLPMAIFGFSPVIIGVATVVDTLFQYWIHTKTIDKMPRWFEYIFNTPSHHRVHHATNPQYLDKNYAATFIIWDRLHKTFAKEEETPVYGITKPLNSLNPIWANFHYYQEMWKGMKLEKGIFRKMALVVRGPEYLGKLLNEPVESPKENNRVGLAMKIYVLLQFIILSAGFIKYAIHYQELSTFYKITGFGLIVITTHICAGLMEGRKAAMYAEPFRLAGILAILNTLYYFQYNDWFTFTLAVSIILSVMSATWLILSPVIERLFERRKIST